MKLIQIKAKGLKGLNFVLTLSDITFLVGSNYAGKSARADAIRLVLQGWLPELGKLASSTFQLCKGKEMIVDGTFDNGAKIWRRWYLKGDSVKTEKLLPKEFEDDANPVIAAMLDATVYFGLSERDRTAYVAENIPGVGGEATPEAILNELYEHLKEVEGSTPDGRMKYAADFAEAEKVAAMSRAFTEWTPKTFLDFALEFSTESVSREKEFAARMDKTAAGLAYLRTQDAPAVDTESLDRQHVTLATELGALQAERAKLTTEIGVMHEHRARRKTLTEQLARLPALIAAQGTQQSRIETLEGDIAKLGIVTMEVLEQARADMRDEDRHSMQLISDEKSVRFHIRENETDLANIEAQKACPYCGATGDGWKAMKAAEINSTLAGLREKLKLIEEQGHASMTAVANLTRRYENAQRTVQLKGEFTQKLSIAKQELSQTQVQIAGLNGKTEELDRIPAFDPALVEKQLAAAEAVTTKVSEIGTLTVTRNGAGARQAELKRLAQAEEQRDEAKVGELVAKGAAEYLRERKAKMVAEAFGPLLTNANMIFGHLLLTPIAYHDGEIGTWRDGQWVSHKTFSGVEKLFTYAAIQASLSMKAPVRLMILDEMLRAQDTKDMTPFTDLISAAKNAVRTGKLDQFIGIIPGDAENYCHLTSTAEEDTQVLGIK